MDVAVSFDATKSPDSVQTAQAIFATNACKNAIQNGTVQGGTWIGPPTIQGFNAPLAFSCNTNNNTVTVTNPNPAGSPDLTIGTITVTGADFANFTPGTPSSPTVKAGTSETIPVVFAPVASVPGRSYSATVEVNVTDGFGAPMLLKAPVSGSSSGIATTVSSQFASADATVKSGQMGVKLPIQLGVTKDPGITLNMAEIQKITLTYRYNTDFLHIDKNNIAGAISGLPAGWTVDPSTTITEGKNGTLVLVLKNSASPLAEGTVSLGTISFEAKLTTESSTSVVLESSEYRRADNSLVQNCVSVQTDSTATQLEYQCGDHAIQDMLNGKTPAYIRPVSPNPAGKAEGSLVSFRFGLRHTGSVSLTILDELGHEAARVMSNSEHPGGTFEIHYDVSNLPSGSYTYRLTLDKYVTSGKLIVNH
jgi:type II secretory pathway pseudopilin PulG